MIPERFRRDHPEDSWWILGRGWPSWLRGLFWWLGFRVVPEVTRPYWFARYAIERTRHPWTEAEIEAAAEEERVRGEAVLRPGEDLDEWLDVFVDHSRRFGNRIGQQVYSRAIQLSHERRRLQRLSPRPRAARPERRPLLVPMPTRRESRPGRRVRATATAGGDDPPDADRPGADLDRARRGRLGVPEERAR